MGARLLAVFAASTFGLSGVAHAQLLDRASRAVRGDDDDPPRSRRDDDDDDVDDRGSLLDRASHTVREPSYRGDDDDGYDDRGYDDRGYDRGYDRVYVASAGYTSAGEYEYEGSGYGVDAIHVPWVLGAFPYANGAPGYSVESTGDNARTAGTFEIEAGYALGGAGRAGVGARLMLELPLDILVRYSVFFELVDHGVQVAAIGRVGLAWRLLESAPVHIRIGGGLRHFQDHLGGVVGVDGSLGVDIFPGSPLVISVDGSIGFVGQAMVAQVRAELGLMIDLVEIYAGYNYEGLVAAEHVDLGGPMLGIRAWL
jgi:hypothetical protein